MVLSSLKLPSELYQKPLRWLPVKAQWSNYATAVSRFPLLLYGRNTLVVIITNIIGALLSNSLIAYGFARLKWPGRNIVFMIVLATMMLPFQVVMIPLFILFKNLGWLSTLLPLIVPGFFGTPFLIFLLRQFFLGIPNELSEAARIDGAREIFIYRKIVVPLSKPALTTVAIFTFLRHWGDFIGPLVFLRDKRLYTLSVGVRQLMDNLDPKWHLLLAAGVMMTLPVFAVFFLLQKYFIEGIT
ncbi:MAG: carbohydrate ABC transporter permease, partial [Armatimonadetes bacterium]|nr:carbohydrate ABC transporter permease [Armatimonadota bacterium]